MTDEYYDYENENRVNVKIEEVYVMPKVERPKHRRRRSLKVGSRDIKHLTELIDNTNTIGSIPLLNAAPNIFKIKKETFGDIEVPGGWNITKGVFNLTVKEESNNVIKTIYIIGYTDSYDVSYSGLFDDRAEFYINKIYVLSQTKTRTGLTTPRLVDVFNVTDNTFCSDRDELRLLRAEDVTLNLTSEELYDDYHATGDNTTNVTTARPVSRSSSEAVGARTVKNMMDSITKSSNNSKGLLGVDTSETLSNAFNFTVSPSLNTIEFIGMISDRSNYNLVTDFTLTELESIFGSFDVYAEKNVRKVIDGDITKDFADLDSHDDYSLAANEILYNISSIAAENALTAIAFKADNLNGKPQGQVLDANTIIKGIDAISLGEGALRTFLVEIWPTITNHNSRDLEIIVDFTSGHKGSKVELAYDGDAFVPFYMASYMDSLLSPDVHTNNSYHDEMRSYRTLKKLLI